MLFNPATKLLIGAGTVTGTVYFGDTLLDDSSKRRILKREAPENIGSIDDIELLEAVKGCAFWFVDSWDQNRTFKARKFFSELKQNHDYYTGMMFTAVNKFKSECQPGASFSFSHNQAAKEFYRTEAVIR